jgi:hypothetical protein
MDANDEEYNDEDNSEAGHDSFSDSEQAYENFNGPNLLWFSSDEIINYSTSPNLEDEGILDIHFITKKLRLRIIRDDMLLNIKIWLLENITCTEFDELHNKFDIDLIFNVDGTNLDSTINVLAFDLINSHVICIIQEKQQNFVQLVCTSDDHWINRTQSWNIDCVGNGCDLGCGILVPRNVNILDLPEGIPDEYSGRITDLDWCVCKKCITEEIQMYRKYSFSSYHEEQMFEEEMAMKHSINIHRLEDHDHYEYDLTEEERLKLYYCTKHIC